MKNYYFIGILGSGMSALARIAHQMGHAVGGSDRNVSGPIAEEFISSGIGVYKQDGSGIAKFAADRSIEVKTITIVKSTAIEDSVSDIVEARKNGILEIHRSDLLAEFFNVKKQSIAVAGTAGKTSVSTMLAYLLDACSLSPSFVIGGISRNFKASSRYCGSDYFVIESDESDGTIVKYQPQIGLLTNISREHKELDELFTLFEKFISNIKKDGAALINVSCENAAKLYEKVKDNSGGPAYKTINFEYSNNFKRIIGDFSVTDVSLMPGGSSFKINGVRFETGLIGRHNVENFAMSITAANIAGADLFNIAHAIKDYSGVARRLEVIGTHKQVVVIDDYAHNPHEIKTAINAVQIFKRPLIAVYQPHGYGPTSLTRNELCDAFSDIKNGDRLIINEIYYAGGTVDKNISSREIVEEISSKHKIDNVRYCETLEATTNHITETIRKNPENPYIVLVMGARDINKICPDILSKISRAS